MTVPRKPHPFARARDSILACPPLAMAIWVVLAMTTFLGPLDISSNAEHMTVGLDSQVACKLVISGLAFVLGVYGFVSSASVRQTLTTLPPLMILSILVLAGLATPIAISSTSLPTVMINCGYLLFITTALLTLRLRGIATALLTGTVITMVVALFLYFLVPKYGLFPELLNRGLIVYRMSGTAHPNAVGRAMMLGLIVTLYLHRSKVLSTPMTTILACGFVLSAYLAWSRTAIAAGMFGLAMLYLDRVLSRVGFAGITLAGMIGLVGVVGLFATSQEDSVVGQVLAKVTKSGDAEEITSGTGRADIWGRALELISSRPIIGHGFSAAAILMTEHSQATHNAVLHASLAAGVIGGALMFLLLLWNAFLIIHSDSLLVRSMSAFIVVTCLAEDAVLETFPGPCTIAWLACLFYPVLIRVPDPQTAMSPIIELGTTGDPA